MNFSKQKKINVFLFILFLNASNVLAQKQMEFLNRGVLAVRVATDKILVSWRIFGPEFNNNTAYNVYKNGVLSNSSPITGASNYMDTTTDRASYSVAAVVNGVEQSRSESFEAWSSALKRIPITAPSGGTTPNGVAYTYEANDASVGDVDGDGDYEIVLKWMPTNSKDNAHDGYTGNTFLQGIEMDGTLLWTIDLGKNIRSGAHYTQFMVYDLDGDGKAEIACKTADGTTDALGVVLGDGNADYRNTQGRILDGPEYFSLFSGETGAFISSHDYIPQRGSVASWGDNYGNRVDRFLACVAYLDGKRPSLVFARGYYTRVVLAAFDYRDGVVSNRWVFDTDEGGNEGCFGQGNHNITVGDVDNDEKDEIQYGSCAIDNNGTVLYTTGFGHGDASHLGDFNPEREGLEYFMVHEVANGTTIPALDYRDPATGNVLWEVKGSGDIGRGVTADIDPNYVGAENWASNGAGIYSASGALITTTYPTTAGGERTYNMFAWFDEDLLREIIDRTVITKWDGSTDSTQRLLSAYRYGGSVSNNGTKSNPCLIADIMGDWREEIIWRNSTNTTLNIFTTPRFTTHRIFTLMHDPLYRTSIAWQNVGYNHPAHTGFFLGHDMQTPESPNIYYATPTSLSVSPVKTGNASHFQITPNPVVDNFIEIKGAFSTDDRVTVSVYNLLGALVFKKRYDQSRGAFIKKLNVSSLKKGLYFVELSSKNTRKTVKLIKN